MNGWEELGPFDDTQAEVGHPQDFFVTGGTVAVNSAELEAISGHLEGTIGTLGQLDARIQSSYSLLQLQYSARRRELVMLCSTPEGAAEYGPVLAALEAAWGRFETAVFQARQSPCGCVNLESEVAELARAVRRASGLYVLTEDDVLNLFRAGEFEVQVMQGLASKLALREYFPPRFTLEGKTYVTGEMNDTELAAVFLSWLQAKLGAGIYGETRLIRLEGNGIEAMIDTPGFEDSPELNAAFGAWMEDVTMTDRMSSAGFTKEAMRASVVFNAMYIYQIQALLRMSGVIKTPLREKPLAVFLRSIDAEVYAKFAASQKATRDERKQNFANTPTGKAIGENKAQRLERKALATTEYDASKQGGGGGELWNEKGEKITATRTLPKDPGDVFRYSNTIDPYGDSGAFEVQSWQDEAGKKGVRVILRGTESWEGGSAMPQDMLTNTEAVAGFKTGTARAVELALNSMGVDDATPVELVGHSQAGIVAVNLAADPAFTRRYNVRSVITAGSPVAQSVGKVPESIAVLSFENNNDLVPKLEAQLNPTSKNHLTVYGNRGSLGKVVEAHNRDTVYAPMADDFLEAHYPQGDHFLKCRDNTMNLNGQIVSAQTQRFELSRVLGGVISAVRLDLGGELHSK